MRVREFVGHVIIWLALMTPSILLTMFIIGYLF